MRHLAPGREEGKPRSWQRPVFGSGGRGSLCMQDIVGATVFLLSRLQRLLAVYRLWLHELRGRLDSAFVRIAGLHSQIFDLSNRVVRAEENFEEVRGEVARTILNFNGRLEAVEDSLEEGLTRQAGLLSSFGAHFHNHFLLTWIVLLQLLRFLQ